LGVVGPDALVYGLGVAGGQGELGRASGGRHFELFDGLRAVAVLLVLCSHVAVSLSYIDTEWPGRITNRLSVGVTIFFVVSGFLLYRPFVRARMSEQTFPSVRRYGLRRFLRIMPAYWVALTVLALWPGLTGLFGDDSWKYYALVQIYDGSEQVARGGLFPAWSLAIELSFYALLPIYAWLIARLTRSSRDLRPEIAALIGLTLLAAAGRAAFVMVDYDYRPLFTSILGSLSWFTPGMALAVLSVHLELSGRRPRLVRVLDHRPGLAWGAALALFAVLCYGIGYLGFTSPGEAVAEMLVQGAVAALVVVPAAFGPARHGVSRRILGWRPLLGLGLVSYGVFLWHSPIVHWFAEHGVIDTFGGGVIGAVTLVFIGLAVSVPIAILSFRLIEKPLIKLGHSLGGPSRRVEAPEAAPTPEPRRAVEATSSG
jgi:peptidoglycan/LPS O-acetylase OafA/YrhL